MYELRELIYQLINSNKLIIDDNYLIMKYFNTYASTEVAIETLIENIDNPELFLKLASAVGVETNLLIKSKLECSKTINHFITEDRLKNALFLVNNYIEGKASIKELDEAYSEIDNILQDIYKEYRDGHITKFELPYKIKNFQIVLSLLSESDHSCPLFIIEKILFEKNKLFQPCYNEWYTFLDSGEKAPILYDYALKNLKIAENLNHLYLEKCRAEIFTVLLSLCKNLLGELIKDKINIALIQMKSN